MRALLIAVLLVVGMGGTAEARRGGGGIVVIVTGDDIEHLRDLSPDLAASIGYSKLGYHYSRFGFFWLDLWRSDGEFVVYDGNTYAPITADELELLGGASVPWRYHLPPLLLVICAAIIAFVVGRKRRKAKFAFAVGGVMLALAALFYVKGLTWEFMIPGFVGLYLVLVTYWAMKEHHDDAPIVADAPAAVATTASGAYRVTASGTHRATTTSGAHRATTGSGAFKPMTTSGTHATTTSTTTTKSGAHTASGAHKATTSGAHKPMSAGASSESGPIASRPSQPLVIERPSQPASVPMRLDDNADAPKLLR